MNYDKWVKKLDRIFVHNIGMYHDDVEDWLSYEQFAKGSSPLEAFSYWLKKHGPSGGVGGVQ